MICYSERIQSELAKENGPGVEIQREPHTNFLESSLVRVMQDLPISYSNRLRLRVYQGGSLKSHSPGIYWWLVT